MLVGDFKGVVAAGLSSPRMGVGVPVCSVAATCCCSAAVSSADGSASPRDSSFMGDRGSTQSQYGTNNRQSHRETFHGTRPDQFLQPRNGKGIERYG